LAFDPELARWSPGTLVMHDALAIASAHGALRVELLGGAEPYKRALTDRVEPLHIGLGLARGARGHAALAYRRAAITARRELARRPRMRRAWYRGQAAARRRAPAR
jgi:CelD/BcsL family acetyltransferase involved in cellulose biosynthesis